MSGTAGYDHASYTFSRAQSDPGPDFEGRGWGYWRESDISSALGPHGKIGVGVGSSSEILGALLSVLSIWVVTGVLVYLAVERLISGDYEIKGDTMLITAGCAVAINIM